jgi:Leucine-rich repeat (LRR) protein
MRLVKHCILFILTVLLLFQCKKDDPNPIINITDNNFLDALIELGIDTDGDGQISNTEAESVTYLDVSGTLQVGGGSEYQYESGMISNMKGIESFINIDSLNCSCNELSSLDVSNLGRLTWLNCLANHLTSLDVSGNVALQALFCSGNQITGIDVSNNSALESLICSGNLLTSLDVSRKFDITYL